MLIPKFKLTVKNFPYVTVIYLLFIITVNTIVYTLKDKNGDYYSASEFYSALQNNGFGFLVPIIQTIGAPGLFINNIKQRGNDDYNNIYKIFDTKGMQVGNYFYILFAILFSGLVIELSMGHIALIMFITIALFFMYFSQVLFDTYPDNSISSRTVFNYYSCCGSGIYVFLIGIAITLLFLTNIKNKGYKKYIYGTLMIGAYFGYFMYDYFLFKRNTQNIKGREELTKDEKDTVLKRTSIWHASFYLCGCVIYSMYHYSK